MMSERQEIKHGKVQSIVALELAQQADESSGNTER